MTDPLTDWLQDNAPDLAKSFAPPVDPAHLADAEKALGRALPASYVAFLRAHDGQRWVEGEEKGVGTLAPIFASFELLGIRHAEGEWRSMHEWDAPEMLRFWPISVIGGESRHHALDEDGRVWVIAADGLERVQLAESLDEFLGRLAAILDEGAEIGDDGIELPDDAAAWVEGWS